MPMPMPKTTHDADGSPDPSHPGADRQGFVTMPNVNAVTEMVDLTKLQSLQQAGTAMLAQANQSSQGVLSLLR